MLQKSLFLTNFLSKNSKKNYYQINAFKIIAKNHKDKNFDKTLNSKINF